MEGIKVTMPFIHVNSKNTEVQIVGKHFIYSEICNGYGLQVDNESDRIEIKHLCDTVSDAIKRLNELNKK